ncbi:MAG TPA: UDP-3-O-(3-hydroxymyristoyl)glucosamine N-acyltransferase [Gemmataceae bacterium]|nr:UDP-3-O-(3-hydroxymyristoyl)glucosamine N-acyltransferase [Gemmataceae bacterium]
MSFTLQQLADLVQGKVSGDGSLVIGAARILKEACPGDITFLEDEKHAGQLLQSRASAAVVPLTFSANHLALIHVADPLGAFVTIVRQLHARAQAPVHGVDQRACIHVTARIGESASIYPFASVGEGCVLGARCSIHTGAVIGPNCRIGDDVTVYPNAVLYEGTIIGNRVIIHANAVIGGDGFGYRTQNGRHVKVPQLGHVEIGDDCEIGACTTIDRGTFMATRIGEGTKIDNLVQIGHNCQIGRHNIFVSQIGIAGSSNTGDYVVIAGQAGVVDHVNIGDRAVIGAKAGVTKDVPAGCRVLGAPAAPEREQKRVLMTLERLPEIRKDVQKIKQHLGIADSEKRDVA